MPLKSCVVIRMAGLVGSTGDKEPLVNAWVNWCRGQVLVGWDGRKLVRVDSAWRVLNSKVGTKRCVSKVPGYNERIRLT